VTAPDSATSSRGVASESPVYGEPRKHLLAPYALAALAGLVLHLSFARPLYSPSDRLGAWALLAILLMAVRQLNQRTDRGVPVVALVCAQVYLFYGVPQFSQETMPMMVGIYSPPVDALSGAVWLVVLGEATFLAAYAATCRWMNATNPFDRILPQPNSEWRLTVGVYSGPAFALHALSALRPDYIPISVRMAGLQIFNVHLALVLLLYIGYRLKDGRARAAAWVLVCSMGVVGLLQGMLSNVLFPVLVAALAGWMWSHASRTWLVALVAFATIVINPAKNEFRRLAFGDKDISSLEKVADRLTDWQEGFSAAWEGTSTSVVTPNIQATASRTSDLLSFAHAIDVVPSVIPYNTGSGLSTSAIYWIPRAVWPSKPLSTDLLYNRYAVEFGYTSEEGTRSSTTGASVFTEGYWNFGAPGVVLFLAASGVMLAVLLGHNGIRRDSSAIAATVYLGETMLLLQPVAVALPANVTFAAGIFVSMWTIDWVANPIRLLRERRLESAAPKGTPDR
jgi:hypothetical protein